MVGFYYVVVKIQCKWSQNHYQSVQVNCRGEMQCMGSINYAMKVINTDIVVSRSWLTQLLSVVSVQLEILLSDTTCNYQEQPASFLIASYYLIRAVVCQHMSTAKLTQCTMISVVSDM